jgi:hypothetical protein
LQRRDRDCDAVVDDHLDVIDQVLLLEAAGRRGGLRPPRAPTDLVEHLVDAARGDRAERHRGRALQEATPADPALVLVLAHAASSCDLDDTSRLVDGGYVSLRR